MTKQEIIERRKRELKSLEEDGLLDPEKVVEFASDPKTALHSAFEWNNTKAGHAYRIWQARQIIVSVKVVPQGTFEPVRAFVSLRSDRLEGGGYRETMAVLADEELSKELVHQALDEFMYWKSKYEQLVDLAPIFRAGQRVKAQFDRERGIDD